MASCVNETTIKQLASEVGEETIALLLNVFCDELEQYSQKLISDPTIGDVREISHSIKSSAGSFGADPLAAMALECEERAKQEQNEWVEHHLDEFIQVVQTTGAEFRKLATHKQLLDSIL